MTDLSFVFSVIRMEANKREGESGQEFHSPAIEAAIVLWVLKVIGGQPKLTGFSSFLGWPASDLLRLWEDPSGQGT